MLGDRFALDTLWIQRHIANCPRCRSRLGGFGRLSLALSLIKSQPHKLNLLSRANQKAIGTLRRDLRNVAQAQKLKNAQPDMSFFRRLVKYSHSVGNAAACLAIFFLIRLGVFASMEKFQSQGQKTVKQYYSRHVGDEMTNDIFPS